jgi:hypothetical protein
MKNVHLSDVRAVAETLRQAEETLQSRACYGSAIASLCLNTVCVP